ncbi:hypothetical protein [Actinophytocola oryzae]|uniref:Uncharacterized protein n=1 Tax=Actinophytocola oryzae TaxID=502181 RepID=A0A4R7W1Q0_9PSEU|nr:hypothetical protein [Actinophytocola oryzae]TDV56342.1 hypothetical protein CLV71_102409 [Actinophytocola oryzae]
MELPPLPHTIRSDPDEDVATVSAWLTDLGVGDGHPVIPPTTVRVESMLGAWDPDEQLGILAPLRRPVTVGDVAVCAVLAGCRPSAMPVLVAAVRAVQEDRFNLLGLTTTTGNAAIAVVLHGDAVAAAGVNAGQNHLGPGPFANGPIGRALATVVRVVGAAVPGKIDVAISGQPAKFGLCFGELPASPGWPHLGEERGGDLTVMGICGTVEVVDAASQAVTDLLDTLAAALLLPVAAGHDGRTLGSGEPVVVVPPEWVGRLRDAGWDKRRVREHLFEKARVPTANLAYGLRSRTTTDMLPAALAADDITLLVAGGPGTKATLMPTWSTSRTVTARLP